MSSWHCCQRTASQPETNSMTPLHSAAGRSRGHAPVQSFGTRATILEWTTWSRIHDRRMRACILVWILMDPSRGAEFVKRLSAEADLRSRFGGYYTTIAAVLVRLGAPEPAPPIFLLDKVERLQQALKTEEKWLESARREVTAREDRVKYFQTTLKQACAGEWDSVIGYESRVPALPPRPPTRRTRKVPRSVRTSTVERVSRKRKRMGSGLPVAPHPG